MDVVDVNSIFGKWVVPTHDSINQSTWWGVFIRHVSTEKPMRVRSVSNLHSGFSFYLELPDNLSDSVGYPLAVLGRVTFVDLLSEDDDSLFVPSFYQYRLTELGLERYSPSVEEFGYA